MGEKHTKFTKYETARVLGARALQIAMDAPLLIEISEEQLDKINHEPMEIAKLEFEGDVLPITIKQPMPKKKSVKVKKTSAEDKEKEVIKEKEVLEHEDIEEKEIIEEGEIMELANPDDESYSEDVGGREGSEELM